MGSLALNPHPIEHDTSDAQAGKMVHAARQFEAVLLTSLFGSLEEAFSSLPGGKKEIGSDDYHSLGLQALASDVSAHGGIGIANMMIRHLQNSSPESFTGQENSPAKNAVFEGLS